MKALEYLGSICALFLTICLLNWIKRKMFREYGWARGMYRLNVYIAIICLLAIPAVGLPPIAGVALTLLNVYSFFVWYSRKKRPYYYGLPPYMCHNKPLT